MENHNSKVNWYLWLVILFLEHILRINFSCLLRLEKIAYFLLFLFSFSSSCFFLYNLQSPYSSSKCGGCQPRVSTSCAMEKWGRGEHILLVSTGPSNSFLTSTRRVLSCHQYLSAILFSVSFSLLLWVLPTKCLHSLTATKASSTAVAVSRSYLQGSLHSWSGSYQKSNHFSSPSHHWHCPLSAKRLWCYLHYSSLLVRAGPLKSLHIHGTLCRGLSELNKRHISLVLYTASVLPEEYGLGIPKSLTDYVGEITSLCFPL